MNFFEHQHQARSKTKTLVVYFAMAVLVIAFMVNFAVYLGVCLSQITCTSFKSYWQSPWWLIITLITLVVILVTSLIRWQQLRKNGGLKAVLMAGAVPVNLNTQDHQYRQLINVVEEMSIASGMPVPEIFVMENELGINAFVAGTEPHNTYLAVTRGCLEQLSRDELQGVIGHEYSHILNGDMRINLKLIGILAGITVIGQLGEFLMNARRRTRHNNRQHSRNSSKSSGQALIIGLAIMIVGYIGLFFARLIKAAISRQREFLADASAVQFTRNKTGIANALYKINQHPFGAELTAKSAEELSHMCFESSHKLSFFKKLLSTHPPTQQRILKIDPYFSPSPTHKSQTSSLDKVPETQDPKVTASEFVTSSLLVGQIGNLQSNHIEMAQQRLSQINRKLASIARGQDPEASAKCLVYGMLVLENTLPRQELLTLAEKWLTPQEMKSINNIIDDLNSQSHEQHWMLLELAIPRIKLLQDKEKHEFLTKIKKLVDCDRKVSIKEYLIYSITKRWLDHSKEPANAFNNYQRLSADLSYLLTVFLASTSNSKEKNDKLHSDILFSFGLKPNSNQQTTFNANKFHQSLLKLSQLNPLLKRPVIEAFASCIASDNRMSKEEFLLLRVVCEYMDCPVPIII